MRTTSHSIFGLMILVGLSTVALGCTAPPGDDEESAASGESSDESAGGEEVASVSDAITVGTGPVGCGRLYRKSTSSQSVYLKGCGTKWLGSVYKVQFNGHNVYHCFSYYGSQYVGSQADIASGTAALLDQPATKSWCDGHYPSIHSGGSGW